MAALLRRLIAVLTLPLVLGLAGCATMGPTSITLTPDEMERRLQTDLSSLFEVLKGTEQRRPEISTMPVSGRLQLDWNVSMPGVSDKDKDGLYGTKSIGLAISLSGRPELDEAGTTVLLREVRIEDIRVTGVPRLLSFGLTQLTDRKGMTIPDLPLFGIEDQLRRQDVAYAASGVEVGYRGLRVMIAPK
jgi:hypothetical protein